MKRLLMCLAAGAMVCGLLKAQESVTIPHGTEVELMALETVSTESAHKGEHVHFAVARDVVVNGEVVLYAGTKVDALLYSLTKAVPGRRDGAMKLVMDAVVINKAKIWIAECNAECQEKRTEQGKNKIGKAGKDVALAVVAVPLLPALVGMEVADGVHKNAASPVQPSEAAVLPACYKVKRWVQHDVKVERSSLKEAGGKADVEAMKGCAQYGDGQPPHDEKVTNGMKVWFD